MKLKRRFTELIAVVVIAIIALTACGQQKTEAQPTMSNSETLENKDSTTEDADIAKKTSESLKPYLDYIGTNTSSGDVEVSQDFLDNLNNVFVMGYLGTVNHALTEGAGDTITSMDWTANETMDSSAYNDFLGLLDSYFGSRGVAQKYDNISQNDVWVWPQLDNGLWPISFNESGKAVVRWYADSAVNVPVENVSEAGQDKDNNPDDAEQSGSMPQKENHTCIECGKPATHSMTGYTSGETEWYCDDHWNEMGDLLNQMQQELGEVEELTNYDAYWSYGSGSIPFWFSEDALERYISASVKNEQGTIDEMTASGEIGFTAKGTKCNIVKSGYTKVQVKLLDGTYAGSTVWVLAEAVQKSKD